MHGEARDSSSFTQIGTQVVQPLSPYELAVRFSLRADAAAFTGREEEVRLITAAADGAGSGGVVAIHAIGGMPGVGKTALAVHVAHRLRGRFPDRQLFVDLHGYTPGQRPVSPEAALAGLLAEIGVDARYLPETLEGRTALWRDHMAGQRAVVILDNAAGSDQVIPLFPGGESCLVLITSRRYLGDLPGTVVPVPLDALPPDKARVMFLRLAARAASAPEAGIQELLRLAGYLPLAISLLARVYTRHLSWTLDELLSETKASLLTLAAEKDSIAAAFSVSYRYLPPRQQDFFRWLGLHLGATIDAYAAAALAGTSLEEAAGHLESLYSEGLLTEVGYRRYGMHDLIRLYARDLGAADPADDRDQGLERLLTYYQHTAAVAQARLARQSRTTPASATVTSRPPAVPDLPDRTQALTWSRAERANLLAGLDYAARVGQHARTAALTAATAALMQQDGPWPDAITRQVTAVHAARQLGDRLAEANALNDLGLARHLIDDYQGATHTLLEALAIYRDLGDRQGQANALDDMGVVYYLSGDYSDAAKAHQSALGIYRELGDQIGQANALNSLGAVRRQTTEYHGAVEAQDTALRIYRHIGDQRGQASALKELGVIRRLTGDYPGAAEALDAALAIYRTLGSRLGETSALNYLGALRQHTGDYLGAADALEKALSISRDIGDRQGQANALSNLGALRQQIGDYPGAADALEKALEIYRDIGDRGGEAEALNETGTLHRVLGDLDRAGACHRQALDLARLIDTRWDEAHALAGLARCALAAGATDNAETSLRQALEIFRAIGAAEAPGVAAELDALTEGRPGT